MSDSPIDESVDEILSEPEPYSPPEEELPERFVVGVPLNEKGEEFDPDEEEEAPALTFQEKKDLRDLMTVGRRTKDIVVFDHKVSIQTLKSIDELNVGKYAKQYEGTQFYPRALQVAVCAGAITAIDGKPLYTSLGSEDEKVVFDEKVSRLEKYYPITISRIYKETVTLESEFNSLMEKLGKLKG